MSDLFNKMKKLSEGLEDGFSSEVEVDIFHEDEQKDITPIGMTKVSFRLDIEYKSYGIKDISVVPFGKALIKYEEFNGEGDEAGEGEMEIDLEGAEIEWESGDGLFPTELKIVLDEQGRVKSKIVVFVFPNKM